MLFIDLPPAYFLLLPPPPPAAPEYPSIVDPDANRDVRVRDLGNQLIIRCEARGMPPPQVNLRRGKLRISSEVVDDASVAVKTLVVTPESVGEYLCSASNAFVPPEGGIQLVTVFKTITVEARGIIYYKIDGNFFFFPPPQHSLCI